MILALSPTETMVLIGVVLFMVLISIFMFFGIKKDRRRRKEEKAVFLDGLITKTNILANINNYISKGTQNTKFSLLFLSVDDYYKLLEDRGELKTRRMMEKVSYRLLQVSPSRTQIAYYEGSQFLIFIKGDYNILQVLGFSRRFLEAIRKPMRISKDLKISLATRLAICFYPQHGNKLNTLLRNLEIAIATAQQNNNEDPVVYSKAMKDLTDGSFDYAFEIIEAMKNKEFVLFYHPIINLETKQVYGVETLSRWNHPRHGYLPPSQFIQVMEESGDINWLGTWGLENLINQNRILSKQFAGKNFVFTMNLSTKQLMSPDVVTSFTQIMKASDMSPGSIILEITEYSAVEKNANIKENITKLAKLGFGIAIDVFSIGREKLPLIDYTVVNTLKINMQLYSNESVAYSTERWIQEILEIRDKHKLRVISEGVENAETLAIVKNLGINLVQGYVYTEPLIANSLHRYLREESWRKGDFL